MTTTTATNVAYGVLGGMSGLAAMLAVMAIIAFLLCLYTLRSVPNRPVSAPSESDSVASQPQMSETQAQIRSQLVARFGPTYGLEPQPTSSSLARWPLGGDWRTIENF